MADSKDKDMLTILMGEGKGDDKESKEPTEKPETGDLEGILKQIKELINQALEKTGSDTEESKPHSSPFDKFASKED